MKHGGYTMRYMSFALTTPQVKAGMKTVTRRLGWKFAKAGDRVRGVSMLPYMAAAHGKAFEDLGVKEFVAVRRERLDAIDEADVEREGFPGKDAAWFIEFFCRSMKCGPDELVTRIEFRPVPGPTKK